MVEVMTSGLPQVCKLWLGLSKGKLPAKHPAPKILMSINYCGCRLAQSLELVAAACHKEEGATSHPGVCKHSLQYEGRPDGRIGVRVRMRKLGCLSGKGEMFVKN